MSTKDFARNNEVSGFSIPVTDKKEEKAAKNCRILTIKMSNIDEQAIRAKLEQGINKNQQHIFRNKEGHLPDDTPLNRQLFIETVRELGNYLGLDKYGTQWYAKTMITGEQIWVQVRNGEIRNAGINSTPKTWHPNTGFASPNRPNP